jgi:DNA-directed RNA polymerase specialized sigma24 family protein
VSLLKYEDLSVRDVARRMGMSEAAVKASAHRGYKLLRRTVGLTDVEHRPAD